MQDRHAPRDGFVERLEWQIGSELRRRHRTGPATWLPGSPLKASAAIVFLVLVSMAVGGAAVAAAVQAQNSERRQLLIGGYERRLALARERLELAAEQLRSVERQIAVGAEHPDNRHRARLKFVEAEASVKVIQLQLQEVQATGAEPVDAISAPLVSGRDFVAERLQAELILPATALETERQLLREVRSRVAHGTAPPADQAEAEVRVIEAEAARTSIERKLGVRREFVSGTINGAQADLRVLEGDAEQRLKTLEPRIALARLLVAATEQRFNVGLVTRVDVAEARLKLSELEAERAKAQLDLALLRKKIEEPAPR
jgi:hypothetical protein